MWIAKIQNAKDHLAALETEVSAFFSTAPYQVATRVDPRSRRLIYYIRRADAPPEKIALLAGDVIQNLRSSLDQLAYQLFIKNLGPTASARHVYFPIGENLTDFNSRKSRYTKGMAASARVAIDGVQPYKGGSDILWQLHALNLIDKHRALITAGSAFRSMDIGAVIWREFRATFPESAVQNIPFFVRPADILFPLAAGSELFIDAPDATPDPDIQFRFEIVLNEPGIVDGKPLIETLQSMVDAVESLEPIFAPELM